MEGSPSFLLCFSPCGHHCSSKDEFALEGTRIERVLWVGHTEPRCVSPCRSLAGIALTVCREEP